MSKFRPPLRKQADNLLDSLEETDQSSIESPQTSQEVLSCGFLPPRSQKKMFQPPLLESIQSPGQEIINRILRVESVNLDKPLPVSTQKFELAPFNPPNTSHEESSDNPDSSKSIRRKHYNYQLGNKLQDNGVSKLAKYRTVQPTTVSSNKTENISKFKVFEFPLSQGKDDDKPKPEVRRRGSSLVQVLAIHILTDMFVITAVCQCRCL